MTLIPDSASFEYSGYTAAEFVNTTALSQMTPTTASTFGAQILLPFGTQTKTLLKVVVHVST
jgi:hypothetical protein